MKLGFLAASTLIGAASLACVPAYAQVQNMQISGQGGALPAPPLMQSMSRAEIQQNMAMPRNATVSGAGAVSGLLPETSSRSLQAAPLATATGSAISQFSR